MKWLFEHLSLRLALLEMSLLRVRDRAGGKSRGEDTQGCAKICTALRGAAVYYFRSIMVRVRVTSPACRR